ncbi:uncharacterized protein YoxC [Virgibacillus natechei]|uniref:Uncharacterized protein YoxC n=1 Tax=Virgibacillus natechei TaxID=1216297 RepID=A0ABS4IIZ5_9BACI|nr:DUF948 domain-containing protein [Virgibacillus natechei]MBP1970902.1 uncharacterized protein YoxC [Virgibacillus natechei]UZD13285.1 DUF948 domain-containing protein [Virgibacillus natechei]
MTLTGIGVLIIGVAFLVLTIFIAHTLQNLAGILSGIEKTVEKLPDQLDDVFKETGTLINQSNDTIADVNDKLEQLSPLFYIVGDVGNVTRNVTSSFVDVTETMKHNTEDSKEVSDKNSLGGLYGSFALGYYLLQKRRQARSEGATSNEQNE